MKNPFLICIFLSGAVNVFSQTRVSMDTSIGSILFEIYEEKAPITSANFLAYVDEKRWVGAHFYRVVTMQNQPNNKIKIEVIQGGLGDNDSLRLPPISHESTKQTNILHQDGTLSMARMSPGTEASEFFICIGVQPELDFGGMRNPDGQGFSAFGKVVEGMDIVLKIQQLPQDPQSQQYLEKPFMITNIRRVN